MSYKSKVPDRITDLINNGRLEEALRELEKEEEKIGTTEQKYRTVKQCKIGILTKTGRFHEAQKIGKELYSSFDDLDSNLFKLDVIIALGDIFWRIGGVQEGRQIITEGETLLSEINHQKSSDIVKRQVSLLNLKSVYFSSKAEKLLALNCLKSSLHLSMELKDKHVTADLYDKFGIYYTDAGKLTKALEYFHASLDVYRELGSRNDIGWVLYRIGWAYLISENKSHLALFYFQRSQQVFEILEDKYGVALSQLWSADILKTKKDLDRALELFQRSLPLFEHIQYMKGIGLCLDMIGQIYEMKSDSTKANQYHQKSLAAWRIAFEQNGVHIRFDEELNSNYSEGCV